MLKDAKVINVFDVRDGYWNCPLFYDETDPDCERNNSRRLCAFQSECGEWMFKCLPQGLSVSGPYFQAWLTRIFRKYDIVMNQTKYVPKNSEEQRIKTVDNALTVAKHIQTVNSNSIAECTAISKERGRRIAALHESAVDKDVCATGLDNSVRSIGSQATHKKMRDLNGLASHQPLG